jgi:hypothetical protein
MNEALRRALVIAQQNLGRSVVQINPSVLVEVENKDPQFYRFGIKNTADIPNEFIDKLCNSPHNLLLTVDKMSDLGRSIDQDLINPLTYRCMTGSTSGGAINIIKGINDFALGTDGGGSVLAPALSCGLYSFIGSGIGWTAGKISHSTESISFHAGIGVIANRFECIKDVIETVTCEPLGEWDEKITIAVPEKGNVLLPDGAELNTVLMEYLRPVFGDSQIRLVDYRFRNYYSRNDNITDIKNIFENHLADVILSFEGPIDIYGYGETIPGCFDGKTGVEITKNSGKGLIKAANICECTAFTIPSSRFASGFVICAPKGRKSAEKAYTMAKKVNSMSLLPEIFTRYFIDKKKFVEPSTYLSAK